MAVAVADDDDATAGVFDEDFTAVTLLRDGDLNTRQTVT